MLKPKVIVKPSMIAKPSVILDVKTFRELPELGAITCQNFYPQFEKTIKQYVLVSKEELQLKPSIQLTPISCKINPQRLILQLYLIDKLKLTIYAADQNERLYQFCVCPKQPMMSRSKEEVTISSSFILTKKWISLCIDFQSFFNTNQLVLKSLLLNSQCKLKQIFESPSVIIGISDGQFMIQRINQKRILELVDTQSRCVTEDRKRPVLIKLNVRSNSKNSIETKNLTLPPVNQKSKVEFILQKNVKAVTGLQVIEEIQRKKRPGLQTQELQQLDSEFKIKAVKSFMRHSDFSCEQKLFCESKLTNNQLKDEFYKEKVDDQLDFESSYNSRVHKFSNTFQKPLGFSSMNFKLAQQNSATFTQLQQHSTQDYFYLSSQQLMNAQEIAQSHLTESQASQTEERLEQEQLLREFYSLNAQQISEQLINQYPSFANNGANQIQASSQVPTTTQISPMSSPQFKLQMQAEDTPSPSHKSSSKNPVTYNKISHKADNGSQKSAPIHQQMMDSPVGKQNKPIKGLDKIASDFYFAEGGRMNRYDRSKISSYQKKQGILKYKTTSVRSIFMKSRSLSTKTNKTTKTTNSKKVRFTQDTNYNFERKETRSQKRNSLFG